MIGFLLEGFPMDSCCGGRFDKGFEADDLSLTSIFLETSFVPTANASVCLEVL